MTSRGGTLPEPAPTISRPELRSTAAGREMVGLALSPTWTERVLAAERLKSQRGDAKVAPHGSGLRFSSSSGPDRFDQAPPLPFSREGMVLQGGASARYSAAPPFRGPALSESEAAP